MATNSKLNKNESTLLMFPTGKAASIRNVFKSDEQYNYVLLYPYKYSVDKFEVENEQFNTAVTKYTTFNDNDSREFTPIMLPLPADGVEDNESFNLEETSSAGSISSLTGYLSHKVVKGIESVAGNLGDVAKHKSGVYISDRMAVTYKGPNFRGTTFVWELIPQNAGDSKVIKDIIDSIRSYSRKLGTAGIGSYPALWDIDVMFGSEVRAQWVACFIESFDVKYSGGSENTTSSFIDGSPIITTISIAFKEMLKPDEREGI